MHIENKVVLPQPFGPKTPTHSPGKTFNDNFLRIGLPSKDLLTSLASKTTQWLNAPRDGSGNIKTTGLGNNPTFDIQYMGILGGARDTEKQSGYIINMNNDFVKESLVDADVLIYMIAVDEDQNRDEKLLDKIKKIKIPLLVLINKIDSSNQKDLESAVSYWSSVFPSAKIIPISALTGFFVEELLQIIIELLPESPAYFPKDQLSDKSERFFVNEAIRKSILQNYDKEVPYAVEVITESFKEEEKIIRIQSVIFVERDTQKGIIIGHQGKPLKKVGTQARIDMEKFFDKKVFLELYVKVNKDWRNNESQLKRFGYLNK